MHRPRTTGCAVAWALLVLVLTAVSSSGVWPANLILDGSSFETGHDGFSCLLSYSWTKHGLAASEPRRGIIDASTAAHGSHSLKLQHEPPYGRKGFTPWCTFRWIPVTEGAKYTVSLYAKGSHEGQALTVSVSDAWQDWGWSNFRLTTEWQRYSHEITAGKTEAGYAWVLVPFPEDGPAWIDGLQLEEGGLTGYAPGRSVDLGLGANYRGRYENLFHVGDEVVLDATLYSDLTEQRDVVLQYSVEDYFGRTPYEARLEVDAPSKAAAAAQIRLGDVPRGSYKATVKALSPTGELFDFEELAFGVIAARTASNVESQFGMHGFPYSLLEECGVRWIRTYLLAWPAVEPERGKFSWPEEREEDRLFLDNLQRYGISALPVLQGTPDWARTETPAHGGWAKDQSEGAKLPDLDAWRTYVFEVVSRYKDRFHCWEVMNEPTAWMNSEDYLPFLKTAYEAAHQADPGCRIVAGDTAWKNTPFLQEMLDRGALDYIDVFSGHFYGVAQSGPPEVKYGTEGADAIVSFLRQAFAEHGKPDLEIWNTEEGTYVPSWYSKELMPKSREPWHRVPDVRRQARDMVRSHLVELGSGIRKVFWFHELYSEQGSDARWIIRPEGMYAIEYDGAPRPALVAYSVMTEKLEGAQPREREVPLGEKLHCYVFARGADSVAAVWYWGEDGKQFRLSLPAGPGLSVSDMMGNPVPAPDLRVTGDPLYIEGPGLSADALAARLSNAQMEVIG
ncbi:MAG: hypothetical protein FJX75_08645 [Armatimonadetes bacterium]|nr:hypothetical protein [Armatimonadota bacterium]